MSELTERVNVFLEQIPAGNYGTGYHDAPTIEALGEWAAKCLAHRPESLIAWATTINEDAEGKGGQICAITGNGPHGEALAAFYALAPGLMRELLAERAALVAVAQAQRAAVQAQDLWGRHVIGCDACKRFDACEEEARLGEAVRRALATTDALLALLPAPLRAEVLGTEGGAK